MSTCPETDIHSIYLDNELPAAYVADYEAHIAECPKCRAKLEKLRMMHSVFNSDSKSMELSQRDLDNSFERYVSIAPEASESSAETSSALLFMFSVEKA